MQKIYFNQMWMFQAFLLISIGISSYLDHRIVKIGAIFATIMNKKYPKSTPGIVVLPKPVLNPDQCTSNPYQFLATAFFAAKMSDYEAVIKEALPVMDRASAKLLFLLSYLCRWFFSCYFFHGYFLHSCFFYRLCRHSITLPSPG